MVQGKAPNLYSDTFVESPEELDQNKRYWWCDTCGAVFHRNHNETDYKFCYNCEQRDAVLIEMQPVGKDSEKVGR
jgi:Zn finger protein HypA/HybF involved in hydrogenase expression